MPAKPTGLTEARRLLRAGIMTIIPILAFTFGSITAHARGGLIGIVAVDFNANGRYDFGDAGLKGWRVAARAQTSAMMPSQAPVVAVAVSDDDGLFRFDSLARGSYWFSLEVQDGWMQRMPQTVIASEDLDDAMLELSTPFLVVPKTPILSLPSSPSYERHVIRLEVGIADNFSPAGAEPSDPDPELVNYALNFAHGGKQSGCDDPTADRYFLHTFRMPAPASNAVGRVIHGAVLNLRVRGSNGNWQNDEIAILQRGGTNGYERIWLALIGRLGNSSGATTPHTIDLERIPSFPGTINALAALTDGTLDLLIGDDEIVDYATLDVEYSDLVRPQPSAVADDPRSPRSLAAYPNPADASTVVSLPDAFSDALSVEICAMNGGVVMQRDITESERRSRTIAVPTAELAGGTYIVHIRSAQASGTLRLCVMR